MWILRSLWIEDAKIIPHPVENFHPFWSFERLACPVLLKTGNFFARTVTHHASVERWMNSCASESRFFQPSCTNQKWNSGIRAEVEFTVRPKRFLESVLKIWSHCHNSNIFANHLKMAFESFVRHVIHQIFASYISAPFMVLNVSNTARRGCKWYILIIDGILPWSDWIKNLTTNLDSSKNVF